MMKIRKWIKEEKGSYIVIFALFLTVLLGIISLGVDVGMMYLKQNKMYEIAQIMRDLRFTKYAAGTHVFVYNSKNPARELAQEMVKYARKNGFDGEIRITYIEEKAHKEDGTPADPRFNRNHRVYIVLKDVYHTTTMKALNFSGKNFDEVTIEAFVSGSGFRYRNSNTGVIYRPRVPGAESATYVSKGKGNLSVEKSAILDRFSYGDHY